MENHPFDRIDPAAGDIGAQKPLYDAIPYCSYCGKELINEGTVGDRVYYKCPADGRRYKMPVDRNAYNEYRHELNSIYNVIKAPDAAWGEADKSNYFKRFKKLADYSFADNDPQYRFLEIAIYTCNFRNHYKRGDFGSKQALRTYKSVMKHMEDCFPLDMNGQILFDGIQDWIDDGAPKSMPKWLKILIPSLIATAAVAITLVFAIMPKEITDSDTGVSATIDSEDYGAFGKWGVDFVVCEVEKTSSEYKTAEVLLKNESTRFVLYDLSMLSGSNYVQPNGSVRIEAPLPEGYSAANVKVYHVKPEEGSYEMLENQNVIASQNLVVFEVDHFSLFAIAEHPRNIKFQIEGASIPTQTLMIGELVSEPETPVREGYVFAGWYNGDKKWSFADDIVPADDLTLVGRWTAKEYNLTLDYADGSKEIESKIAYDQQYTLEIPDRIGYSFGGWFDEEGNRVTESGIWKYGSDIKLTARWELEGYKIRFDANGGSVSITEKDLTYGEKYGDLPTPTRAGYSFDGWYTTKDSGGRMITSASVVEIDSNHTIYARWTANNYTVLFDANGGTCPLNKIEVVFGLEYGTLPIPTRAGYEFLGWYTASVGGRRIDNLSVVDIYENHVLYALWSAETCSVIYNPNGGNGEMANQSLKTGESVQLAPCSFLRKGYSFVGWSISENGSVVYIDEAFITNSFSNEIKLYAVWEANVNSLFFNSNGGSGTINSISAKTDETVNLPNNLFVRDGYIFMGWSVVPNGAIKYTNCQSIKMPPDETVTLYAVWGPVVYSISYNLQGGTIENEKTTYHSTDDDFVLPTPMKVGHIFRGWSGSGIDGLQMTVTVSKGSAGDLSFTANWEAVEYTISFNANDGGKLMIKTIKVVCGEYVELPVIEKTGATFEGWYVGETKAESGEWSIAENIVLEARWKDGFWNIVFEISEKAPYLLVISIVIFMLGLILAFGLGSILIDYFNFPFEKICNISSSISAILFVSSFLFMIVAGFMGNNMSINNGVLTSVTVKSEEKIEVPYGVTEIGSDAFSGFLNGYSQNVESIVLPETVESISENAFSDCRDLREIYIGSNVKYIGGRAFARSDNLIKIYYNGTEEEWNAIEKYTSALGNWDSEMNDKCEIIFLK